MNERVTMINFLSLVCEHTAGEWITLHIDEVRKIQELLKEQQQIPVKDVQWREVTKKRMITGICHTCNSIITHFNGSRFCDKCGQAVKWE